MIVKKIFGPPGTGKTTRLLSLMEAELAGGVPPDRLAYLTFTVAARHEAKTRARSKFGFTDAQLPWFKTLHAVTYQLLGVVKGAIVNDAASGLDEFAKRGGYEFTTNGRVTDEGLPAFGFTAGDKLLAFDHFRRHRLLSVDDAYKTAWPEDGVTIEEARRFVWGYELWKKEDGRVDFTDLLERGGVALPCDVVIVDEAQDLSPLQWRAFWQLAAAAQRVYLAGDDDQAIYEWAGASPGEFLAQPGEVEVLPQSYRCPTAVADLAKSIIERVHLRQPKAWRSREAAGAVTYAQALDQIAVPQVGTVLYLYRNHRTAIDVEVHLRAAGEVYERGGKRSITPEVTQAIITWERLRTCKEVTADDIEAVLTFASPQKITPWQRTSLRACFNNDTGFKTTVLESWLVAMNKAPWFHVLDRLYEDEFYLRKVIQRGGAAALTAAPRIRLSTIHGAKGAEADHVVLHSAMSPMVRKSLERDSDTERRVWYVGVTRAKETLTVIGVDNPLL